MRVVILLVLAACGRVAFDPRGDAGSRCPDDFVFVAGNAALGTSDFCVMRFEAKARALADDAIDADGCDDPCGPNPLVVTHVPAGVPEGAPWRNIDAVQSQLRCRALGEGYDLIANREWMTIARDAELVAANWSSGVVGTGRIVEGMTDGTPSYTATSDPTDPYSDTGNSESAGWEQRRTLVLASGDVVWDLPGHTQEWIDWTLGGAVDGAPTPCANAEITAFACPGIVDDDFNSSTGTYDSTNGVGTIIGGSGDATRRGGQFNDQSLGIAGIYGLNMNRFTTDTFNGTGFRCVLRL